MHKKVRVIRLVFLLSLVLFSSLTKANSLKTVALKNIASQYYVIFFYSGNCTHCHAMATNLEALANNYDLQVIANKFSGPSIDSFKTSISDINLFSKFNVQALPTIVLIERQTKQGIVISTQALMQEELETALLNGASRLKELL